MLSFFHNLIYGTQAAVGGPVALLQRKQGTICPGIGQGVGSMLATVHSTMTFNAIFLISRNFGGISKKMCLDIEPAQALRSIGLFCLTLSRTMSNFMLHHYHVYAKILCTGNACPSWYVELGGDRIAWADAEPAPGRPPAERLYAERTFSQYSSGLGHHVTLFELLFI